MKLFRLFISICILSLTTTAFAADEVKPGGVDKPKVAEKSEAGIKLGSVDLPQVAEKSEAGAKALVTLKEMYDKFQVTLKTKEKYHETVPFGEYQQFGKKAQQEFAQKQAELSKQIKDDLDKLVKDYGRDHGYALILNKEGLVYSDSKYEIKDLTDEILKGINTAGKK
ncbi:MAG: OmpH family outer membrane protein [Geobacteraceae bacterium]